MPQVVRSSLPYCQAFTCAASVSTAHTTSSGASIQIREVDVTMTVIPLSELRSTVFDLFTTVLSAPLLVSMDIDIDPNTDGLPGISQLRTIVGAVMTIGLILSVLALIVSAIVWGFGANSSNPHLASRGKVGVLASCGAAVICGASVTLINFFWNVGQQV